MYNFIDVNQTQTSGSMLLPSEAMKINGEYIESLIPGYRTLTVEGREALTPELSTYETGIRDGATLMNKRYPPRTIRVTYQLLASSNVEFRNAYNKLAQILDVKNAQLIFADELGKFFTGTPSYIGEVTPGRNSVVGEFEILCTDPFKYSLTEYEVTPVLDSQSIMLNYGGTYKAFPRLVAEFHKESDTSASLTGAGECGYVAFFNDNEKIIQLGDPEETDMVTDPPKKSQTLVSSAFDSTADWGSTAKSQWPTNSGFTSPSGVTQVGSMQIGPRSWRTVQNQDNVYANTVLDTWSRAEAPNIRYMVSIQGVRTSRLNVELTVAIGASLQNESSYFNKGFVLVGDVSFDNGSTWTSVQLKGADDSWEGTANHIKTFTIDKSVTESGQYLTGIRFRARRTDTSGGRTGVLASTACSYFWVPSYTTEEETAHYLTPSSYGSGNGWHGPSITRKIPADSYSEVGAKYFRLKFTYVMAYENGWEQGAFQALVVSGSGASRKVLAGVGVYKEVYKSYLKIYLNGAVKETITIDFNKLDRNGSHGEISKTGNSVTFNVCGIQRTYNDSSLEGITANEVTLAFEQSGTSTPLHLNGVTYVDFRKDYTATIRDVPNKFGSHDVVEANCNTGEIFLNGVPHPEYGALGNDWEGFYLKPGINEIGFSYSDWVDPEYAPEFKLKYREVFL